ncbi:MAG: OmpA family protein [Deltaproteobacteria bacterium]|jgi:peptidoglycan-associated lipoprotein
MRLTLVAIGVLSIVSIGFTGCASKGPVQTETFEQAAMEEKAEEIIEPCTNLEMALARAQELTHNKYGGATQYDGAIHFAFDSYSLSAQAKEAIDAVVQPLLEVNKNFFIELQGHTDGFGEESYNFQLGLNRARAVMGYLHQTYGLSLQQMNGFSCGELKPVADNDFVDGRAENRRVTLVVIE